METAPTAEAVYQGVYALYNNPDKAEKEKASQWLDLLQKSVYSWTIADELLQQKRDLHSCYFAAQTMRNKIQTSFHELPEGSHESLRDSLIAHILQINSDTDATIVTQLCLALADLALLMSSWSNPILELIEKLSPNPASIYPLILVITHIPEEINSRTLRLGSNRRDEVYRQMEENSRVVCELLNVCMTNGCNTSNVKLTKKVIQCFTAWVAMRAISVIDTPNSNVVVQCFNILNDPHTDDYLHDVAADCLCAMVEQLEDHLPQHEEFAANIFASIQKLENSYHMMVATENTEKAMHFCRLFTILSETFLKKIVNGSLDGSPHYSVNSLDLVLSCVGHYDYEVSEITFNLWYKLSEELYTKDRDQLTLIFQPHIHRLIGTLYRQVQMEPDHEGLIDADDGFGDFRRKASELIKDVVFIIGSNNCFKQMFVTLQEPNITWERTEAALFVMENVAKNILPDENDVVPKVAEAILSLPENTHVAVRYRSLMLIGELCDWIENHPETLQAFLNFLLYSLQQKNGLAPAAANALTSICTACRDRMICHMPGLTRIAENLESYDITNETAIGLLKGMAIIISRLNKEEGRTTLQEICSFQLIPLRTLVDTDVAVVRGTRTDPAFWLDRLAAVLRHTSPDLRESDEHPCFVVMTESWPVISKVFDKYQNDVRIMERACRCVRYTMRCIGKQAAPLLEPLVKQMVVLYQVHKHSCFLYLGSILVDEFSNVSEQCTQGLLHMLQAFIQPSFEILQLNNGLKNHPDTVDDFFRLCSRFIQRCAVPLMQSPILEPIIQCALLACTLDHRDANLSVMKFLNNMLICGQSDADHKDGTHEIKTLLVSQLVACHGKQLVTNLLNASVFYLHSYMLSDVADVFVELKRVDKEATHMHLRCALDDLPKKNSGGCVTATPAQVDEFYAAVLRADTSKAVTHALKEFTRLYR